MDPWSKGEYWDRLPHEWKVWRAERTIEQTKKFLAEWEIKEKAAREEAGPNPKPWDCQYIRRMKQYKKVMQDNLKYWEEILAGLRN